MKRSDSLISEIKKSLGSLIVSTHEFRGETTFVVTPAHIVSICKKLKQEFGFHFIADLTAVDYLGIKIPRFEVVYYVHRFGDDFDDHTRIRLKVPVDEKNPVIDSVTCVWKGVNWLEREVYDMFGIKFRGHPDLRRILMPEDYEAFPLRKDFDVKNRKPSQKCFERDLLEGNN